MDHKVWLIASLLGLAGPSLSAAADAIRYQPPEAWVLDPPSAPDAPVAADAPFRMLYLDNQIRVLPDGTEEAYTAYRLKVLKPEALPAGNVQVAWAPNDGGITIHYLRLIRDGRATDVLASSPFTVLQREEQLEQSVFTGRQTATLQVPGLRVGDEIAFAATVSRREVGFGGRVAGLMQMPVVGMPGAFRFRLLWPHDRKLAWRGASDLPPLQVTSSGDDDVLEVDTNNPKGAVPTEGAPPRYNVRRLVQYSDFGSWADVSRELAPLYEKAAVLSAASPVKAEAAAIAARMADPTERTQAAPRLVQDRIRYVFVALDGGNYVPATAEETWRRRFGDCKAKTVLLLALLRELGVQAEPALVNSAGGDGMDQWLPGPRTFNHMIVRATVKGETVWLDGARLGDRYLDNLPSPYRWALPLNAQGADLEKIPARDRGYPLITELVDIDATAGLDQDARVSLKTIVRGDEAFVVRTKVAGLSAEDADRALKSYWRQQIDWLPPDKVSWSYDERPMALTLSAVGRGNPGWKGDAAQGRDLGIPHAGFFPPDPLRRPLDQDQSAGWTNDFPRFRCSATTVRLPRPGGGFAWSLYADPMNRRLGGVTYWRASSLDANVVRAVMSTHSYEPEVSPEEAKVVNAAIPGFNNNQSSISEEKSAGGPTRQKASRPPFDDTIDWLAAPTPCSPPG